MLRGRTVVVGVSGGIAAYKACELVRWLKQREAAVIVVMTPAATEFVGPLTFQTLSGNPVVTGLWGDQRPGFDLPPAVRAKARGLVEHVDVAEVADAIVLAPATADLMARLVHGEAPDALTAVTLASRAPLVVCPAMDVEMWGSAAVQANVKTLRARGATLVGPESGPLASGLNGLGRLAATEAIGEAIERVLARRESLAGVKVLVVAGRTEEPLDPVRVLTNRSSGRMGFALAEAARDRGADVTLVAGHASIDPPGGVTLTRVSTAAEMHRAVLAAARDAAIVVMAAAVSDYRPAAPAKDKLKRAAAPLTIALTPNPDILAAAAARRAPGQVFVGFALETSQGLAHARRKRSEKGVDLIVLNSPADGLGGETNRVTLVEASGERKLPVMAKREVAEHILERAIALRGAAGKRASKRTTPSGARRTRAGRIAAAAPTAHKPKGRTH